MASVVNAEFYSVFEGSSSAPHTQDRTQSYTANGTGNTLILFVFSQVRGASAITSAVYNSTSYDESIGQQYITNFRGRIDALLFKNITAGAHDATINFDGTHGEVAFLFLELSSVDESGTVISNVIKGSEFTDASTDVTVTTSTDGSALVHAAIGWGGTTTNDTPWTTDVVTKVIDATFSGNDYSAAVAVGTIATAGSNSITSQFTYNSGSSESFGIGFEVASSATGGGSTFIPRVIGPF